MLDYVIRLDHFFRLYNNGRFGVPLGLLQETNLLLIKLLKEQSPWGSDANFAINFSLFL